MKEQALKSWEELALRMASAARESATYEKLATYIEKNRTQIVFMTAGETAAGAGVSQGSVSRFCVAIGYRGYSDFLRAMQTLVSEVITAPQRLQYTSGHKDGNMRSAIETETANLRALPELMKGEAYKKLLNTVAKAPELALVSARMSATILPYMTYILRKMRSYVREVTPECSEWDYISLGDTSKTHIFAIVFPRYSSVLINKLRELHEAGFTVTTLTDSPLSPAVPFSDNILYIPITVSSIFDIYSTPMTFLNLMLRDASKHIDGLERRMSCIEECDMKNRAYYRNKY